MKILIVEDNLIWSSRLKNTLAALGHEAIVVSPGGADVPPADVAIVNLSAAPETLSALVEDLRSRGVHVIGHAGHKEREVRDSALASRCDQVLSNSQVTYKIEAALTLVDIRVSPPQS